jgi:pimeloyl-ACP methyl ester carboxylesterase
MSFHQISVCGHTLAAQSFNIDGAGQPIILLHGITASIAAWHADQLELFGTHGPCYALSLPGHYPARFPEGFATGDITAEMIAEVLAQGIRALVGDRPVTLVGHSTGGFAALAIAATHPGLVARVISIAGFARGEWTGLLGVAQRWTQRGPLGEALFRGLYATPQLHPAILEACLRIYAADRRQFHANPAVKQANQAGYPNYRRLDLRAMAHYFRRMPAIDISGWLPRVAAPTLLVTGTQDPIVPASESQRMAPLIRGAELALIDRCGHVPFLEQRAAFDQIVTGWMRQSAPAFGELIFAA